MATLRETIHGILLTDAQSAVAGSLGVLLGYNAVNKPRCVYFRNPPEKPDFPLVTYFSSSQVNILGGVEFNPRTIIFTFTAWGNNFEAVLERIFNLLQKKKELTPSDYSCKAILFDVSGPDMFDDDFKIYYRAENYRVVAVKI